MKKNEVQSDQGAALDRANRGDDSARNTEMGQSPSRGMPERQDMNRSRSDADDDLILHDDDEAELELPR
jgi:hypothetical protein